MENGITDKSVKIYTYVDGDGKPFNVKTPLSKNEMVKKNLRFQKNENVTLNVIKKPKKLDTFMYALMKEASRDSLIDFLQHWEISKQEYYQIEGWFKANDIQI